MDKITKKQTPEKELTTMEKIQQWANPQVPFKETPLGKIKDWIDKRQNQTPEQKLQSSVSTLMLMFGLFCLALFLILAGAFILLLFFMFII